MTVTPPAVPTSLGPLRLLWPDRVTLVAPLGVRFWDSVSESAVGDGLIAHASPADDPRRHTRSFTNPGGIHVFRDLPGLRAFENGAGDARFWGEHTPRLEFIVEVEDARGRFQPFSFRVRLPVRQLLQWDDHSSGPPSRPTAGVPLFSTPSRGVPAGCAVIRAELWNERAGAPAAWAILEAVLPAGPPVRGLADREGRVAVIFPYPEPPGETFASPPGSPPRGTGTSLFSQTWDVELRAFYAGSRVVPVMPDLHEALMQPEATLWSDSTRTRPLGTQVLQFARELIVRSAGADNGRLLVTPIGSPP
jgi:hypothetical protein